VELTLSKSCSTSSGPNVEQLSRERPCTTSPSCAILLSVQRVAFAVAPSDASLVEPNPRVAPFTRAASWGKLLSVQRATFAVAPATMTALSGICELPPLQGPRTAVDS